MLGHRPTRTRRAAVVLPALLTVVALSIAACAGDDGEEPVSSLQTDDAQPGTNAPGDTGAGDDAGGSGGSGNGSGGSGNGSASDADLEKAQAYAECLRENGLDDFQDPQVGPDGNLQQQAPPMSPEGKKAVEACADLTPDALQPDVDTDKLQDALLEYAQCMRDNGFDMEDPDFSGPEIPIPQQQPDNPAWVKANEQCADVLAAMG